jgi:hypothetical protein
MIQRSWDLIEGRWRNQGLQRSIMVSLHKCTRVEGIKVSMKVFSMLQWYTAVYFRMLATCVANQDVAKAIFPWICYDGLKVIKIMVKRYIMFRPSLGSLSRNPDSVVLAGGNRLTLPSQVLVHGTVFACR